VSTPLPPDDAQRELEQRALRNVRGLVDKMEGLDRIDQRSQKRTLIGITVGALIGVAVIVAAIAYISGRQEARSVVIDPAKLPPITPGPAKK
jgi:hypothetical protein